jgi:hypothetical protein
MSVFNDDTQSFGDMIEDDFDLIQYVANDIDGGYDETIAEFFSHLNDLQLRIVKLVMDGYKPKQIREILKIDFKSYQYNWNIITNYDNKRVLYDLLPGVDGGVVIGEPHMDNENVQETYRNTSYSISSISKQLRKKKIKDNHILQRKSDQWANGAKSELVSDILRGKSLTQIIIDEEFKAGVRMQWLIDGKQRCTVLDDYLHDGFAVSKNVKNYMINYTIPAIDGDGNEILNEEGFPYVKRMSFDIRKKKFSQLPEELKEIFEDRQIPVLYNMNCSKQDIADDIARFNRSKPMNTSQLGWLGLEEGYAELAENITKMEFFQVDFKGTSYTEGNHDTGVIRRIVVESIMVSDFIDDYVKSFEKICEYLTLEATDSNFTSFYGLIDDLTEVVNEKVAPLFNAKNSFLWLGLFSRFREKHHGLDNKLFVDFAFEFIQNLHSIQVDGIAFDELNEKGSKDKLVVINKMNHLERLMGDYLNAN